MGKAGRPFYDKKVRISISGKTRKVTRNRSFSSESGSFLLKIALKWGKLTSLQVDEFTG
jgi:hypothetical protein